MKRVLLLLLLGLVLINGFLISQTKKYISKETEYKNLENNFLYWVNSPLVLDDEILFFYKGNAKKILIAGDFNGWKPILLMREKNTNFWEFSWIERLPKGKYRYKLVIDDIWTADYYNTNSELDNSGQTVSYFTLTEDFIPKAKYPLWLKDDIYVFRFEDPKAKRVSLVGNFNNWNPYSHPMKNNGANVFEISIRLKPGLQIYCFVVDGEWVPDYNNLRQYQDHVGNIVSVFHVK